MSYFVFDRVNVWVWCLLRPENSNSIKDYILLNDIPTRAEPAATRVPRAWDNISSSSSDNSGFLLHSKHNTNTNQSTRNQSKSPQKAKSPEKLSNAKTKPKPGIKTAPMSNIVSPLREHQSPNVSKKRPKSTPYKPGNGQKSNISIYFWKAQWMFVGVLLRISVNPEEERLKVCQMSA